MTFVLLDPSHLTSKEELNMICNARATQLTVRGIHDHVLRKLTDFDNAYVVWKESD